MSEQYGPATITEVKREPDLKGVNGFNSSGVGIVAIGSSASTVARSQHSSEAPDHKEAMDYSLWGDGGSGSVAITTTTSPGLVSSRDQQCCLVENGRRCLKPAGNASYSKRIQKTVAQKKLKLYMDNNARHIYICDYHKTVIQSLRAKRKRKDSDAESSGETDPEHPEVDLYQLQVNTLRRYKKHYKVPSRPGLNKAQLADSLMRHFKTIPVVEKEALTFFIYMIKTGRSKFDRERRDDVD